MKSLLKFILAFSVITLFSCGKDTETSTPDGIITMKIDGVDWKSLKDKTSATIATATNSLNITGISADGSVVTLTLKGTTAKTYLLNKTSTSAAVFVDSPAASNSYASNQGEDANAKAIITEVNTKDSLVSGTFNFTGFILLNGKKVIISSGDIKNVKIVQPATVGSGFFKCKLDGKQFNANLSIGYLNQFSGQLLIGGSATSGLPSVYFNLDADINTGVTQLDDSFFGNNGNYSLSTTVLFRSTSGQINITKHDKVKKILEGTFSFDGEDLNSGQTTKVTEGSFSNKY
jgi:hypothetical protein